MKRNGFMTTTMRITGDKISSNYGCAQHEQSGASLGPVEVFVRNSYRRRIELQMALTRFLEDYRNLGKGANDTEMRALQSYDFLLRKWSEFMDIYQENWVTKHVLGRKATKSEKNGYFSTAKKARDRSAEISNKLKHNDRFLVPLSATSEADPRKTAYGYRVMLTAEGTDQIDDTLHDKAKTHSGLKHEGFSYVRDAHSLMAAALRTDVRFGELLLSLGLSVSEPNFKAQFALDPLKGLAKLNRDVFPWETEKADGIELDDDRLSIGVQSFPRLPRKLSIRVTLTLAGNRSQQFTRGVRE